MPRLREPVRTKEEAAAIPADQPVVIEIDAEPAPAPETPKPGEQLATPEKIEPKPETLADSDDDALRKQLDELTKSEALVKQQLADARAREDETRRALQERDRALHVERGTREQAEFDSVLNAIGAAQAEADKAQADYEVALGAQDFRVAAEAQRRLSTATARMVQLEDAKGLWEQRREELRQAPPQRPAASSDPVDQMPSLSQRQRDWLKGHRDILTDPEKNARVGAAHYDAIKLHPQDSDGYFTVLEEKLGYRQSQPDPQQRKGPPVSAPVSRDAPSLSTGRATSTRVELSAEQREHARISGVDDVTYAKNFQRMLEMKKQGHYQERG